MSSLCLLGSAFCVVKLHNCKQAKNWKSKITKLISFLHYIPSYFVELNLRLSSLAEAWLIVSTWAALFLSLYLLQEIPVANIDKTRKALVKPSFILILRLDWYSVLLMHLKRKITLPLLCDSTISLLTSSRVRTRNGISSNEFYRKA